jgi:outer membrane protein assembly factor BamD (BamD/ComL family)
MNDSNREIYFLKKSALVVSLVALTYAGAVFADESGCVLSGEIIKPGDTVSIPSSDNKIELFVCASTVSIKYQGGQKFDTKAAGYRWIQLKSSPVVHKYSQENTSSNNLEAKQIREAHDFEIAMKTGTSSAMKDFISMYPRSEYMEYANSQIEMYEYKNAEKLNTVEAYNKFLDEHSDSNYSEQAEYRRSLLIHTINGYDSYMSKYPDGIWIKRVLFKKARLIDSVEAYDDLLRNVYPNDGTVIYYRDRAALNEAKENGSKAAFKEFIEKYPHSDWIDQAKYFYEHSDNLK